MNTVLSGGSTMFPNINDKLLNEIKSLANIKLPMCKDKAM